MNITNKVITLVLVLDYAQIHICILTFSIEKHGISTKDKIIYSSC